MVRILLFAAALVAALEGTSAASQKPEPPPPASDRNPQSYGETAARPCARIPASAAG